MENIQDTSYGKTYQERSAQIREKISDASLMKSVPSEAQRTFISLDLRNGTMQGTSWAKTILSPGELSTHWVSEFPREENASTLSQILLAEVPEKYYLSPKACLGILRRASVRGKELPEVLRKALERQAAGLTLEVETVEQETDQTKAESMS